MLLDRVSEETGRLRLVHDENGDVRAQKIVYVGPRIGISLCGIVNDNDQFEPEFYFPWHEGNCITTQAACQIQRHADKDAFSGICDEQGLGVSLIFYVQNQLDYLERELNHQKFFRISSVMMSGLSVSGKILLPVSHESKKNNSAARFEDVYSIVESSFMPFGVECDQYSVIGEISEVDEVLNQWTGELVYRMTVKCNGMNFQVCINAMDLMGVPAPGRRFKGTVWMQGIVNMCENR